jgi:hypothetical protein
MSREEFDKEEKKVRGMNKKQEKLLYGKLGEGWCQFHDCRSVLSRAAESCGEH